MSIFEHFLENPIEQFNLWYEEAKLYYKDNQIKIPFDSATLCTVGPEGQASGRIILLKEVLPEGFTFYTNYNSRKALHVEQNNKVSLVLHWGLLGRQVRIEGDLEKLSLQHSDRYFKTRARKSQIGAHASEQSSVLKTKAELIDKIKFLEKKFDNMDVPRPSNWGGYLLRPSLIEFWLDGEFRIHDRLEYKIHDKSWSGRILSP